METKKQRVMVVDDNAAMRALVQLVLESEAIELIGMDSGMDAIAYARAREVDLVLLDIEMPEMTGFEVCQRFRTDPRLRDIPICFFSASFGVPDLERAQELGVTEWLTKPFDLQDFRSRIRNQLRRSAARSDPDSPEKRIAPGG